MKHRIRGVAGATALVLLLGAAACGDDDDDPDTSTEDTAADGEGEGAGIDAACEALIDFNGAVMNVEIDETSSEDDIKAAGEELAGLFAPIAENAPDAAADAADELKAALDDLAAGDAAAFNSDATFETYTTMSGEIIGECGYNDMAVTAVDYGFEGISDTVEAGPTAIALTNSSETEEHEVLLLKKQDGETLTFDELLELPEEESQTRVDFVGAAFAPPGEEGSTLANLTPGEYMAICFIPVGGAEDGPPHFTQGMKQEFTVE